MEARRSLRTAAQIASALLAQESDEPPTTDSSSESEDFEEIEEASSSDSSSESEPSFIQRPPSSSMFLNKLGQQWSPQPLHGTVGRPSSFNRPQNVSQPSREAVIQGRRDCDGPSNLF